MTHNDRSQLSSLEQEIKDLRRQHSQLRQRLRATSITFVICAFICVTSGGAMLQVIGRFQKSVQVDDANQRLRAVLYADNNQNHSGLEIRDPVGNARVVLHTNQNHDPYLNLIDKDGRLRVDLGIGPDGAAYLLLKDQNGNNRHQFVAAP